MSAAGLRQTPSRPGALVPPVPLIDQASGAPVSAEPLLDYLDDKFSAIYGL